MKKKATFLSLLFSGAFAAAIAACGDIEDPRGPACTQLLKCCDALVTTSTVLTCGLQPLSRLEDFQCEIDLRLVEGLARGSPLPDACAPTGTSTVPPAM